MFEILLTETVNHIYKFRYDLFESFDMNYVVFLKAFLESSKVKYDVGSFPAI